MATAPLLDPLGRAGQERTEAQLQSLGDNLVWVEAGSRNVNGVRTGTRGTTTLTLEDADAIRREVPAVARVSPNIDGRVLLAGGYVQSSEIFDPATDTFAPLVAMTRYRYQHAAVRLADGRVLVVGGDSGGEPNIPGRAEGFPLSVSAAF